MDRKIRLGQVFTPPHLAEFMAELLQIRPGDVVLDSCAGEGALLSVAVDRGAEAIGIECDRGVFERMQRHVPSAETFCMDSKTEEIASLIRSKPITKVLLNPPFEPKNGSFEILMNTLDALKPGTRVALILPSDHLNRIRQEFISRHRIDKIVKLPFRTFKPYVSIQTSLFLITAGVPQNGKKIFGCWIERDGLYRNPNEYRIDKNGVWEDELRPYWIETIVLETGDDSVIWIDPDDRLSYDPVIRNEEVQDGVRVDEFFTVTRGMIRKRKELPPGEVPLIGAGKTDAGFLGCYDVPPLYSDAITVSCNGKYTGFASYHEGSFNIMADVLVLTPKKTMTKKELEKFAGVMDKQFRERYDYRNRCTMKTIRAEKIRGD